MTCLIRQKVKNLDLIAPLPLTRSYGSFESEKSQVDPPSQKSLKQCILMCIKMLKDQDQD